MNEKPFFAYPVNQETFPILQQKFDLTIYEFTPSKYYGRFLVDAPQGNLQLMFTEQAMRDNFVFMEEQIHLQMFPLIPRAVAEYMAILEEHRIEAYKMRVHG